MTYECARSCLVTICQLALNIACVVEESHAASSIDIHMFKHKLMLGTFLV